MLYRLAWPKYSGGQSSDIIVPIKIIRQLGTVSNFRVRARTVDMLGRQQIAGIPTAISELFKNAYDAYARIVEVDHFRTDRLFVLRDDGLGMTREDFDQRWLTLGTESKVGKGILKPPYKDPDQPPRPLMGEKGIGRLAIAIIGPQVLVLTRARTDQGPCDRVVAAYLHWGMFELPGLNLEDITVPVREFQGGNLPDRKDVEEMVAEASSTLKAIESVTDVERAEQIRAQMKEFNVDPLEYSNRLGKPSLVGDGCGTHFYIVPSDTILDDDIDIRETDTKATRFEKHLIGFTNTMKQGNTLIPMAARFRDYRGLGEPLELIGEKAFFTPDEFSKVDHHFIGRFDRYGQFKGKVGIYQMKPDDYILNWNESDGKPTDCGPFSLSFAYMQGRARDSLVPPEEHVRLKRKLDRHGGLYIYRDGIRVQPYGDSDYDWLDIERNRTLGAAYYFYSYRRMFGFIELNQTENGYLVEKAGREGFRENKAYRQLRSILMNFFQQTAGDFFREEGKHSDIHVERKEELNRNEEIRRKQAKKSRKKIQQFAEDLNVAFTKIDELDPETSTNNVLEKVQIETEKILVRDIPKKHKIWALLRSESNAREKVQKLRESLLVAKPRGVGISRKLTNEWVAYQTHFARLDAEVLKAAEEKIELIISSAAKEADVPLDKVVRVAETVKTRGKRALKAVRELRDRVNSLLEEIGSTTSKKAEESYGVVRKTVDVAELELERIKLASGGISEMTNAANNFELQIISAYDTESRNLLRMCDQLNLVSSIWDDDGYDSNELTEALEEELEELKARRDANHELAQIGMAINSISHEFDKTVASLRDGLRKLKAWSDANPELNSLYQQIRTNFDHLDEYLTLFTPLDRRLHRTPINITGKQIYQFLNKLFQMRLSKHEITLEATEKFLHSSVLGYPSSLYPPFVNLVDNAIFWVQRNHDRKRNITLDAEDRDLLVRDNGPGVSLRDRENIFSMNFSRKPGGRGMGLSISSETLSQIGMKLTLDTTAGTSEEGAVFRISPDLKENC